MRRLGLVGLTEVDRIAGQIALWWVQMQVKVGGSRALVSQAVVFTYRDAAGVHAEYQGIGLLPEGGEPVWILPVSAAAIEA